MVASDCDGPILFGFSICGNFDSMPDIWDTDCNGLSPLDKYAIAKVTTIANIIAEAIASLILFEYIFYLYFWST